LLLSSVFNPSSFLLSASSSSSFCYFFFFLFVMCFTSFQLFYNLAFVSSTIFLCCFFLSGSSKCYFFSFVFWFSVFLSFCWCILCRLLFWRILLAPRKFDALLLDFVKHWNNFSFLFVVDQDSRGLRLVLLFAFNW
jgi:hypothetical protein